MQHGSDLMVHEPAVRPARLLSGQVCGMGRIVGAHDDKIELVGKLDDGREDFVRAASWVAWASWPGHDRSSLSVDVDVQHHERHVRGGRHCYQGEQFASEADHRPGSFICASISRLIWS